MSLHLCQSCSCPTDRLLCPPCARRAFRKLRAEVEASNVTLNLMRAKLAALRTDAGRPEFEECLDDCAHGESVPPYACGCAACLRSIGLTAARVVAVIVALALAACAHPDARPRHYSENSGSGK